MKISEKESITIGIQVKSARQAKKWSQAELARRCQLNIRTIQRIENNESLPYLYTLKIIEEVLDTEFSIDGKGNRYERNRKELTKQFKRRRTLRFYSLIAVFTVLFITGILSFSDIPKAHWAPFVYIFFAFYLFLMARIWRCPGCNKLLSDNLNAKYCPNCGLHFDQ